MSTGEARSDNDVSLLVRANHAEYRTDWPIRLQMIFVHQGSDVAFITTPVGADHTSMFTYELVDVSSQKRWEMRSFSPKSIYADWRRPIPPGGQIEVSVADFRYRDGGDWAEALPPGRYRLTCVFDESKAVEEQNRTSRVLRAPAIDFTVVERPSGTL